MGRRAKCHICKCNLDTDTAYKVITYDANGKEKKFYFCSKEEYDADKAQKEKASADKDKVYKLVCDIIGRKEIINTILWKEWKLWALVASDEIIGKYLEENKEYLTDVIARLDDVEFNRIRYLSAILKNKLGDYKPKVKESKKVTQTIVDEHYETKFKNKTRIGLEDLEEDCCE